MSKAKKASAPIGAKTSWKNAFKRDWQLYLILPFMGYRRQCCIYNVQTYYRSCKHRFDELGCYQ